MFQTKIEEKIKIHILCPVIVFRKSCHLWDNVEKFGSVEGHRWQYGDAHCRQYGAYALHAG